MAAIFGIGNITEVATTTSLKTLWTLLAPTNQKLLLHSFHIDFKGVTASDPAILVQLIRFTTSGTCSDITLVKRNSDDVETLQAVAKQTFTVEPTPGDVLKRWRVHPMRDRIWTPPGLKMQLPIKGGERVGLSVTASVSIDCVSGFEYEE